LPTVQAGPQNEMAIEESPGFAEKGEKIFAHLGSARASRAGEDALVFANFF
jgi:hypothetical protein